MTGYLLLVLAAVIAGIALGGLIILAGSCSEEARSRKLGAQAVPPLLTGAGGNGDGLRADSPFGDAA